MSEYWKSTPKYWCKHCSTYVRDTKLERTNHEATGKHQSALKRFLRDIHRSHENELREKDRAKREIERLNGVVRPSASTSSTATAATTAATATAGQRQQQWEQLAQMGIDVPTELRRDMAMAGEWTVTKTRIIDDPPITEDDKDENMKSKSNDTITTGSQKRPRQGRDGDDEEAEGEGARDLFKKPRRWGRDTKNVVEDDAELDALLSTPLTKPLKKEEGEEDTKKQEVKEDSPPKFKKEELETTELSLSGIPESGANEPSAATATVKEEPGSEAAEPVIVFKKRKPKNLRQK
ncbi:hypothetical protein GGR50DRAFT_139896 [Xylaria sp. CBS 124048]|nr:hypothetical protein GGR50DRAFT_139896 [Xylaria sp. CBS 124048]